MGRDAADFSRFNPDRIATVTVELGTDTRDATDVVIGLVTVKGCDSVVGATPELEKHWATAGTLTETVVAAGATSKPGSVTVLGNGSKRLAVVGLGNDLDLSNEDLRRGAGHAIRRITHTKLPSMRRIVISLDTDHGKQVAAVAQGAVLAIDQFTKISNDDEQIPRDTIVVIGPSSAQQELENAMVVAEAIRVVRDWVNTPPNLLGPSELVGQAKDYLGLSKGINVEVLDEKALAKGGYGGILAVGGGSVRPPRLLRADYHPKQATKHLVLVGKGVTYDSGGYNLKTESSLLTMKQDMAGAATVVAALRVIATLGLPLHVTIYAPIVESMISGAAYRPGDVITTYDGTTVENSNSDCEGRIILADALARAAEDSPELIVDVATLTGACIIALGERTAGLMVSSDPVADDILDAAELAGEDYWQLPVTEEVRSQLSSPFADLKSKNTRSGGTIYAAAFLQHFTKDHNWAHLDIAGPAWNTGSAHDYVPANATGTAVRTLVCLAALMTQSTSESVEKTADC